jgi:hypothetical protein
VPPDIDLNFDSDGSQVAQPAPAAAPQDAELNALLETQSNNGVELDFDLGETPPPHRPTTSVCNSIWTRSSRPPRPWPPGTAQARAARGR